MHLRARLALSICASGFFIAGCEDETCSWVKTDQRVSGQHFTEASATLCGDHEDLVCLELSSPNGFSLRMRFPAREGRARLDSPVGFVTVERLERSRCTEYATCLDVDATIETSGDPEPITVHTHQYVHVEDRSCGDGYPALIPVG